MKMCAQTFTLSAFCKVLTKYRLPDPKNCCAQKKIGYNLRNTALALCLEVLCNLTHFLIYKNSLNMISINYCSV